MKTSISREELKQWLAENKNIMVIDVRSKEEYLNSHISFAANLPVDAIEAGNFIPEPGRIIITACGRGGGRATRAANYFREHSSNEVYTLDGGSLGWLDQEEQTK